MPDQLLSDQIALSDDSGQSGLGILFQDGYILFDAGNIETPEIARILLSDLLQFQDSPGVLNPTITIIGITENLADTLSLSDSQLLAFTLLNIGDGLALSDSVINMLAVSNMAYLISDNIGLIDLIAFSTIGPNRITYDSLNLFDNAALFVPYVTIVSDAVSLQDTVGYLLGIVIPDSLNLSDGTLLSLTVLVGDNLAIMDGFSTTIFGGPPISIDTVGIMDSVRIFVPNLKLSCEDNLQFQDFNMAIPASQANAYLRRYLNDAI